MAAERPLLVSRAWVQAAAIVPLAALAGAHVLASRRDARRRGDPSD